MEKTTEDTVKELIRSVTGNSSLEIHMSSLLVDDLDLDSVDFASLIMAVEDEFAGVVEEENLTDIKTVKDIVVLVENELSGVA